jgi:hypothetical protein
VYGGGGNVIDFLALAAEATAKTVCAVRDTFRQADPAIPRLSFADVLIPMQGPAARRSRRRSACSTPASMVSAPTCNTTPGAPVPLFQGNTLHNMPALFSRAWAIVVRAGSGRLQRRAGDGLSSQRAVRLRHQRQSRPAGRPVALRSAG